MVETEAKASSDKSMSSKNAKSGNVSRRNRTEAHRFPRASSVERTHSCSEKSCPKHFAVARFDQKRRKLIELAKKTRDEQKDLLHLEELEATDDELWIVERLRDDAEKEAPVIRRVNARMLDRKVEARRRFADQKRSIKAAMKVLGKTLASFLEAAKEGETLIVNCGSVDALTIRVMSSPPPDQRVASMPRNPPRPFGWFGVFFPQILNVTNGNERSRTNTHTPQHCMTCGPALPYPTLPYFSRCSVERHVRNVASFRQKPPDVRMDFRPPVICHCGILGH